MQSKAAILRQMIGIGGWLDVTEASLLIDAVQMLPRNTEGFGVVEIGSYCGKSTVVLAQALRYFDYSSSIKVYAIDPHEGNVRKGEDNAGRQPTFDTFQHNMAVAGVSEVVECIRDYSFNVQWSTPIGLLFIDGLHDYESVSTDFYLFQEWIRLDGFVAFHDYSDFYPGVMTFVDELLTAGLWKAIGRCASLILLERNNAG